MFADELTEERWRLYVNQSSSQVVPHLLTLPPGDSTQLQRGDSDVHLQTSLAFKVLFISTLFILCGIVCIFNLSQILLITWSFWPQGGKRTRRLSLGLLSPTSSWQLASLRSCCEVGERGVQAGKELLPRVEEFSMLSRARGFLQWRGRCAGLCGDERAERESEAEWNVVQNLSTRLGKRKFVTLNFSNPVKIIK